MNITYLLHRGLEEYELDLSYSVESSDPDCGIMSPYAIFEGAEIWLLHDGRFHPCDLTAKEEADIGDWLNENVDFDDWLGEEY